MAGELTEEDIRNMSPEQLRQLQKQQCIFCAIIAKRVQARIVYEDEQVMGVLDINPANPGHVLLMPKEHYSVSPQMPDELFAHIGMIAKGLSKAMLRALGAQGTTVLAANGVAAGQRASHFMMHVIPRREGDNVGIMPQQGQMGEEQLRQFQDKLRPMVQKAMGVPETLTETPKEQLNTEKAATMEKPVEKAPPAPAKSDPVPQQRAPEPQQRQRDAPPAEKREPVKQPDAPPRQPDAPQSPRKDSGSNLDDITTLLLGRGQ
jgi:histidine triad (HIT) family protein